MDRITTEGFVTFIYHFIKTKVGISGLVNNLIYGDMKNKYNIFAY